jgi:hypothetical protein
MPQRFGYFAGYRLVSALAHENAFTQLARWPSQRIRTEVLNLL